ncbi:hypothetical protein NBRC13296_12805 [Paenibacillus chitinolyticus]|uniref:hypothetical protein n=1 Tax=Paenibacillus chitinolyticus TaxID=79263 RepID=UPI0035577658
MNQDIHSYFGLSYANYLVLPRTVLQSMPMEWQIKFVELLEEVDDTNWRTELMPKNWMDFLVKVRDKNGRFISDPLDNYDRGRRRVFDTEQ